MPATLEAGASIIHPRLPEPSAALPAQNGLGRRDQHFGMQRAVNRAAFGDVQQPGTLLGGELAVELQLALRQARALLFHPADSGERARAVECSAVPSAVCRRGLDEESG